MTVLHIINTQPCASAIKQKILNTCGIKKRNMYRYLQNPKKMPLEMAVVIEEKCNVTLKQIINAKP